MAGDGVESVDALTRAHVDAIRIRPGIAIDAAFSGPRFLTGGTNEILERFADGTTEYRIVGDVGERRYNRQQLSAVRGGQAELVGWTLTVLPRYLNTTESHVERLGDDPERYRVVTTGRPRALTHDARSYRAVGVVDTLSPDRTAA